MSEFDSNPFSKEGEGSYEDFSLNLLEENVKHVPYEGLGYGAVPEESEKAELLFEYTSPTPTEKVSTWMSKVRGATTDIYGVVSTKINAVAKQTGGDLREREMHQREQSLAERERTVKEREATMGIVVKKANWPFSFYPLVYHNIQEEIPERYSGLMQKLYLCLLADWACLIFNWAVIFIAVFSGAATDGADSDSLWATLYVLIGVPCAWRFWYNKAYIGSRDAATTQWAVFFLSFTGHTMFCAIMALGVPGTASGGLFFMFKMISRSAPIAAIFSFICSALWAAEAAASFFLLQRAHAQWKTGGEMKYPSEHELQLASVAVEAGLRAL